LIAAAHSKEPYSQPGLARRSAPFVTLLALGFGLFLVGSPRHWWWFIGAVLLVGASLLLACFAPWRRLPRLAVLIPPLLVLASIALLRQGQGGSLSGYGALFLIPTLWVALYGTRTELLLILVAVATAFWAPVAFVGGPAYPSNQWRAGGLLVVIVGLFGIVMQQLIEGLIAEEARRVDAERRLREAGAYEVHDDVVQNLTVAQLALALDDPARAASAVATALGMAQAIVGHLLHNSGEPGSLVRSDDDT
jgi:signal transduction histidine kinase